MTDLDAHRPALLRHCYRMVGSFADAEDIVQDVLLSAWKAQDSYSGAVPVEHWLMRIATNACLNELARRKRRALPQLEREPAASFDHIEQLETADWLTPAPDDQLGVLETRETVALAFLALLQRLPPRQRAVLLLKDVVGWPADEIAEALEMSVPSVNSALHRARETVAARPATSREEPAAELVEAYIRSWETHDLATLVTLLRDDIVFAMPPHATWFHDAPLLGAFLGAPRFTALWAQGFRLVPARANGQLALAFYAGDGSGFRRHSLQLLEFAGNRVAEVVHFIGPHYFQGFALPQRIPAQ
jgi:RNA polymerase sigma-70 factor, ECF subfamily